MAINNERELEMAVREVVIQLDKMIFARVQDAKLEAARRQLVGVRDSLRRKEELSERQVKGIHETAAALREVADDDRVNDLLWDVTDYFELRDKR